MRLAPLLLFACLLVHAPAGWTDDVEVEIRGLPAGPMAGNVEAHVGATWIPAAMLSSARRRQEFLEESEMRATVALRPYGYYAPEVSGRLDQRENGNWLLRLDIDPGDPVRVRSLILTIEGPGSELEELREWRADWPLPEGAVLDQTLWSTAKDAALELAEAQGYLRAAYTRHEIALDLIEHVADLALVLDTGPRARMGEVSYEQDVVRDWVLVPTPRFEPGDPYLAWYVDKLRNDLWRTGYFDQVSVVEERRLEEDPPVVDFLVSLTPRHRDTHQGTIGYGSDSEFRMQYRFNRNRVSSRGDSLAVAFGLQQRDEEYQVATEYRLPRKSATKQFWTGNWTFKTEKEDLDIRGNPDAAPLLSASGRVDDLSWRVGRLKFRNLGLSQEQLIESIFVQYLVEESSFGLPTGEGDPPPEELEGFFDRAGFRGSNQSFIVGMDWDWPVIQGQGFQTTGHHERAWVFTSNEAWGSERDFTQVYLSSRWNLLFGERWMLLLRGEAGWSDATVNSFEFEGDSGPVSVSLTELPYLYRFKAGGSRSVRGYDFEELSESGVGANNLLTFSAEIEWNFTGDWSAAAFFDIGNAFNHWSDTGLQRGAGVGLRWYTIAGALRVDYARALDRAGEPWQIHFTIGTPLL